MFSPINSISDVWNVNWRGLQRGALVRMVVQMPVANKFRMQQLSLYCVLWRIPLFSLIKYNCNLCHSIPSVGNELAKIYSLNLCIGCLILPWWLVCFFSSTKSTCNVYVVFWLRDMWRCSSITGTLQSTIFLVPKWSLILTLSQRYNKFEKCYSWKGPHWSNNVSTLYLHNMHRTYNIYFRIIF